MRQTEGSAKFKHYQEIRSHMRKEARTLFVMPEDGIAPVADAIERAQSSLDVKMFLFTEYPLS
jgi:negative regulator of sigma E activity